jgi:cobalt/nickel transport protein
MKSYRPLWIGLVVMALASPLGLYLPDLLQAGAAWGEWGLDEIKQTVGYAPSGMEKLIDLWKAPISDYGLPAQAEAPRMRRSLSYILAALLGVGICGGTTYLVTRWLVKRDA